MTPLDYLSNAQFDTNDLVSDKKLTGTVADVVSAFKPARPLYILFPDRIARTAKDFLGAFPGKALYAVKTNPHPVVLRALWDSGVTSYDVASIHEIRHTREILPDSELYFMHTVKSPEAINEAYHVHGIRHFVLDCEDELYKILRETGLAQDLKLFVRLALPKNDTALIDFSSKFGASMDEAVNLLKKCRPVAETLGVSFHVGTQTTSADEYAKAISYTAKLLKQSGVKIDTLNVGGGFPVPYTGDTNICTVADCVASIKAAMKKEGLSKLPLLAEPGRILSAQGGVLIARVELRKNDLLYINDGVYGGLFDACSWLGVKYPVRAHRAGSFSPISRDYRMAGPTCDSLDMMEGPFTLPEDMRMGDWVEFQNTGAYSESLRSNFNGFGGADTICLYDN